MDLFNVCTELSKSSTFSKMMSIWMTSNIIQMILLTI